MSWQYDLDLARDRGEPDYDIVDCHCGHTVLIENAVTIDKKTYCLSCYEEAKQAWESNWREP